MLITKWKNLPQYMKNDNVKVYYEILKNRTTSLIIKRFFDIFLSLLLLVILSPIMIVISIIIKLDSPGEIFFRQTRVTQYGREFKIFKFRTMVRDAYKLGPEVTSTGDSRITKTGKVIRKFRLDEFPQLINVFTGDMSFVGTRPEVPKYVKYYTDEMLATLLLPAGVTSFTSIKFKNEAEILRQFEDVDGAYAKVVLPQKMKTDLEYIKRFNFFYDIKILFSTVLAVIKKD